MSAVKGKRTVQNFARGKRPQFHSIHGSLRFTQTAVIWDGTVPKIHPIRKYCFLWACGNGNHLGLADFAVTFLLPPSIILAHRSRSSRRRPGDTLIDRAALLRNSLLRRTLTLLSRYS